MRSKLNVRALLAMTFLTVQLGLVLYSQTLPTRYFCWAPNDYETEYTLHVTVNGRPLTSQEIQQRYRKRQSYVFPNKPEHLIDIVRQYETTYGARDHAQVWLTYSLNGHEEKQWRWPE